MKKTNYTNKILILMIMFAFLMLLASCDVFEVPNGEDPIEVTITFETGVEGLEIEPITGRPNTNIPPQEDPVRDGYRFTGWTDEEGNPYRLTRFPKSSITITAGWVKLSNPTSFTITFITGSNEYIEPIILNAGDMIPALMTLKHFTKDATVSVFNGWLHNGALFDLEIMPQMDLELIAQWKSGTNVLYFESDNYISPIVANPNEPITAPNVTPIKEGYTFRGWYLNNLPFIFDKMPNTTTTLKAVFLENNSDNYNETTSLPKLFINLEGNKVLSTVNRETYVNSSITLTNTDEAHTFNALSAEFRGRGHGSWTDSGPKRGYRIKFKEKHAIFGQVKSRHWVLLAGANFYDTTMLRNMTAYQMSNALFSNIDFASHTEWVELYVNGLYRGVYVLAEHIRVDKGRVDIDKDYGVLDTGYLIEYDAYAPEEGAEGLYYFNIPGFKYGFTVNSPDPDDVMDGKSGITEEVFRQQVEFIRSYMDTALRAALGGTSTYETFETYADVDSFVDMYILHELLKNTDTGWSSFYMYKEAGGKLFAGAPWDFDASAGTNRGNQTPQGIYVAGSVAYESAHTASELYIALMKVPAFKQKVVDRFKVLAPQIESFINDFISDTFIETHKLALGQNFYFWSMNHSEYKKYANLETATSGWVSETKALRKWILDRVTWLSNEWHT